MNPYPPKLHTSLITAPNRRCVLVNRYPTPAVHEPEQFWLYDVLLGNQNLRHNPEAKRLLFVSTYRGDAHYKFFHPTLGELTLRYRYAKDTWRNSPDADGLKTWNFPSREIMEAEINSAHGLLIVNGGPADELTLETFQYLCGHPEAKTGFFCHLRNRYVACKPSPTGRLRSPGHKTWERKLQLIFQDIKTLTNANLRGQALELADTLPTCLTEIANQLTEILPEWRKIIHLPSHARQAA